MSYKLPFFYKCIVFILKLSNKVYILGLSELT